MLPADRVLGEMAALGLTATELGSPGFLPADTAALTRILGRHGLRLVGGFVALPLHERDIDESLRLAREAAELLTGAGGEMFVLAPVQDLGWSAPAELDDDGWRRLAANVRTVAGIAAEHELTLALHPHLGSMIETADQVRRALELFDVGWCLDTGHLTIGGVDPLQFVRDHGEKVVHVHLKDVDASLVARVRAGELSQLQGAQQGLFVPLGEGDAGIGEVLDALDAHGYDRWLVLEQDTAITADEPAVGSGPMLDVKVSIAYLHHPAQTTQEVHQ
jgi:inosose dehydratase